MKTHRSKTKFDVARAVRRGSLVLAVVAAMAGGGARAVELPRYKFTIGQELTYRTAEVQKQAEGTDKAKPGHNRPEIKQEFIVTVVAQNTDGSQRILFRNNLNYGGRDRWSEGYFDMAADGRIVNLGSLSVMANPLLIFPPLPADAANARVWSASIPLDETRRDCKAASTPTAGDAQWSFVEDHRNVFSAIYEVSEERDYLFDVEKGLVRKITSRSKQGWPAGFDSETRESVIELAAARQLDSAELVPLKADMERYFAAVAAYEKIMAAKDFAHITKSLDQADATLRDLKDKLTTPLFKDILNEKLKQLAEYRKYEIEEAERFARLIGKPSDAWKTTDLEGNPRTLDDYRGKVVLLDFWYRGCGWCIRAMPQFKQLVDDFPKDKVAILGMNNDRNLDDARFVIEKMGLNYPTLKNGDGDEAVNKKYGVQGWPTLVVLDGDGVIRHIHVGYSATLRQELGEKIRELLAEEAGNAK